MFNYHQLDAEKCQFVAIGPLEDLPSGERLFVEIGRRAIVILNLGGELYAIEDVCSHDDGPVGDGDLDGYEIICPRHGARFDVRTGEVITLPAVADIPAYPVRVVDGQIELGIPVE